MAHGRKKGKQNKMCAEITIEINKIKIGIKLKCI